MTAQERPAGRLTHVARPAGARGEGRGTGPMVVNPAIIRAALEHSDSHAHLATAARFGVSLRTIGRWRSRRTAEAEAGREWPTADDVAYWAHRQPARAVGRRRQRRWVRERVLTGGPLLIDATGTTRRLRALAAIGWRYRDLSEQLGVCPERVGHLTQGRRATVLRATAAAVTAVYDRLSMSTGPSGRSRAWAAARGWAPPLAWDDDSIDDPAARPRRGSRHGGPAFDEIAVQRAMHGDRVHLRPPERADAVQQLTARGLSAAEIAARLAIEHRSVTRHRRNDTTRRSA